MVGRIALLLCLCAALAYAGSAYWQTRQATNSQALTETESVRAAGLVDSVPKKLAAQFTDIHGILLADPPTDPSKLVDPPALVLGHLDESDSDSDGSVNWKDLDAQLSKAIGRPVTDVTVENGPSQVFKIRSGEITLMALHAADAPFLVNNCGYEPVAVLGDESGAATGKKMDIVVRASSDIKTPMDLKGKDLFCSHPQSIVGYRAAVVQLSQKYGLRPNVDYYVRWTPGQKESVLGIADGSLEAAAISDDKLNSLQAKGKIKPVQYRIIDHSEVFPRMTIGYFYNLKPELAAKFKEAVLAFKPTGSDDEETPLRFIPTDYKKDFAVIREIDDRFDPRLEPKDKHSAAPTTSPVAVQ